MERNGWGILYTLILSILLFNNISIRSKGIKICLDATTGFVKNNDVETDEIYPETNLRILSISTFLSFFSNAREGNQSLPRPGNNNIGWKLISPVEAVQDHLAWPMHEAMRNLK